MRCLPWKTNEPLRFESMQLGPSGDPPISRAGAGAGPRAGPASAEALIKGRKIVRTWRLELIDCELRLPLDRTWYAIGEAQVLFDQGHMHKNILQLFYGSRANIHTLELLQRSTPTPQQQIDIAHKCYARMSAWTLLNRVKISFRTHPPLHQTRNLCKVSNISTSASECTTWSAYPNSRHGWRRN